MNTDRTCFVTGLPIPAGSYSRFVYPYQAHVSIDGLSEIHDNKVNDNLTADQTNMFMLFSQEDVYMRDNHIHVSGEGTKKRFPLPSRANYRNIVHAGDHDGIDYYLMYGLSLYYRVGSVDEGIFVDFEGGPFVAIGDKTFHRDAEGSIYTIEQIPTFAEKFVCIRYGVRA